MLRPSILVVDDNATLRDLMKLHLETDGYDVALAEDAVAAGWRLLQAPPDLLIVDINMPFMNGVEFVETMLADRSTRHIPVLFVTYGEPPKKLEALQATVLGKPFRVDQLLAAVGKELSKARCRGLALAAARASSLDDAHIEIGSGAPDLLQHEVQRDVQDVLAELPSRPTSCSDSTTCGDYVPGGT